LGRRQNIEPLRLKVLSLRDEGFSYREIGNRLNISTGYAYKLVPHYGKFKRYRHCSLCNKKYEVNQHGHDRSVYCSHFCANKAWNLGYVLGIRPVRDTIGSGNESR
jgi:hypothetical protein